MSDPEWDALGLSENQRGELLLTEDGASTHGRRRQAGTGLPRRPVDLTHASFFSGVGGLDRGLEAAGFRTVSFSEIDPYASAVLAERWPGIPNLGDIVRVAGQPGRGVAGGSGTDAPGRGEHQPHGGNGWQHATLWTGGFPCQDLSVAGKRRGMGTDGDRTRSGLAFAFLDLVERYRPPAIVLENVPGLLSSHAGRDFGALLGTLGKLGYGWAYRVLDAQFFGVPQRRRRVFIVALDSRRGFGADGAAEVLSVGSRCDRHPPAGIEAGPGTAERARGGVDVARAVTGTSGKRHDEDTDTLIPVGSPTYADRMRSPDELAGGLDDRQELAATLNSGGNDGGFRTEPGEHLVAAAAPSAADGRRPDDGFLPLGLDSHRYRCCGNGVVSTVPEWFGRRLAEILQGLDA